MTSLAGEAASSRRTLSRARVADAAIVALTLLSEVEIWTDDLEHPWAVAIVVPLSTLPLLLRRRYPLLAPVAPAVIFAAASFFVGEDAHTLGSPMLVAAFGPFLIGRGNDRQRAVIGLAISFICVEAFGANFGSGFGDLVFLALLTVGPWTAGQVLRSRDRQAVELRERAEQLEAEREQHDRAARAAERLRIARELHDVIAHSIGVMTIQAGAARMQLDGDASAAVASLRAVAATGRQTLAEMRRLLGALDADTGGAGPGLANLDALVHHCRGAGLPVSVNVEGTPEALGAGLDLAAYRIVQEALTNALKYAGPASAQVVLRYTPDGLELEIADDGDGSGTGTGGGHGLVGMRERAAIYGGRLDAGPRSEGGFEVRAQLPLERAYA